MIAAASRTAANPPRSRSPGLCLALVLLSLGSAERADAWTCDTPQGVDEIHVTVLPRTADRAARNTHVWVFGGEDIWPHPSYASDGLGLRFLLRKQGGATVATQSRAWPEGGVPGVELIPAALLSAHTRYEVLARDRAGASRILGSFSTGELVDQSPPHGAPVIDGRPVIVGMRTDAGADAAMAPRLTVGEVSDDVTPSAALLYAVWGAAPDGTIDYERSPQGYFVASRDPHHGNHDILHLGSMELCESPYEFRTPVGPGRRRDGLPAKYSLLDYASSAGQGLPWKRGARMRIGVRARDLAGNSGEPVELLLNFDRPGVVWRTDGDNLPGATCNYARPAPNVQVLPRPTDSAPRNVQVRVLMNAVALCESSLPKRVELRTTDGRPVPGRVFRSVSVNTAYYEFVPQSPLSANRLYRVFDDGGKLLSSFRTGQTLDEEAPTGLPAREASLLRDRLKLELGDIADESTPRASLLLALWSPQHGNRIDFTLPPTAYVLAPEPTLWLDNPPYVLPPGGPVQLIRPWVARRPLLSIPAERKHWRIGLRVVDLAGNFGPPFELAINSTPPLRR